MKGNENIFMRPMRGDIVRITDLSEQDAIALFGEGAPFFTPDVEYEVEDVIPSHDGPRLKLRLYENEIHVAGKTYATRRRTPDETIAARRCSVIRRAGKPLTRSDQAAE